MSPSRITAPEIEGLTFVEHLGSGGYSEVFLYERQAPRMRVAVKVLKDARLGEAERRQFAAEAETMAELADHPYIVQVFSTGILTDGRPYLVMKYYPPPNLGVRCAQERFPVAEVLRTGIMISSAVETAHRAGIVHRDIKPANVLVSSYGEPGLTDFGIAGHATETELDDDLGLSIPWSPPEVISGGSNGSIQSDVYSLAATVWHLLVGRSPFEVPGGDNSPRALMNRVLRTNPPSTGRPDVPASLERLLAQAMNKKPGARPRTALEFARGLQAVEQEQRFGRTEIVVEGPGTGGRPRTEEPERPATPPDPAARARQLAAFAPPAPAEPATTARPSVVRAQPVQAPPTTARPAVVPAQRAPEPPTTARPAVVPASPRERHVPALVAPEGTVRRPTTPADDRPAEPGDRRRGFRRGPASIIAGLAVVAAIVVGILVSSSGGGNAHRAGGTKPTTVDTEDLSIGGGLIQPPTGKASYDTKRKVLHFSWNSAGAKRYSWYAAGRPTEQSPPTTKNTLDIPTSHPADTCIQVIALDAANRASTASGPICGSAP